ncbi:holin [Nonomuraea sp. NPDC050328]|uniref:holin n=1 Tax=Nonomuraea sp. NPDC050328 TaxID=3364361 RepID=UPI0037A5A254
MKRPRRLLTGQFWGDAAERMVRAGASAAVATVGTGAVGIADIAWPTVGSVAAGAAVVSLLLSLIAGTTTSDPTTAGFTTHSAAPNAGPYPLR